MHRTLTTRHIASPDVEYRVSLHQPKSMVGATIVSQGEPWVVVEVYHRQPDGSWIMIASLRETAFLETVADIGELADFIKPQSKRVPEDTPTPTRRVLVSDDD